MKMYRCSLTGFFSNVNDKMVYDENKTVILNILFPYEFETDGTLAVGLMYEIFVPHEPSENFPLRVHRMGGLSEENEYDVFSFYKKDDPMLTDMLNNGGRVIEHDGPLTFKINKLTDEQKQADEFSSVPYLDAYDVLIGFTDDKSTEFESRGYMLPKIVNQQIIFTTLTAVDLDMKYRAMDVTLDNFPSISCVDAGAYLTIALAEDYATDVNTSGTIKIVDTVAQTAKSYYFNNFSKFINSKWVRDTIALNHQSLIINEVSGSEGHIIGLYGEFTPTDVPVNSTKISIELNNPAVKLIAERNLSITGSGTNVVSVCLNPDNYIQD